MVPMAEPAPPVPLVLRVALVPLVLMVLTEELEQLVLQAQRVKMALTEEPDPLVQRAQMVELELREPPVWTDAQEAPVPLVPLDEQAQLALQVQRVTLVLLAQVGLLEELVRLVLQDHEVSKDSLVPWVLQVLPARRSPPTTSCRTVSL